MAYQRGDVVLIPFPFTDLTATKTRPAVVISSASYHKERPELLVAYVSSQITKAAPSVDYVLTGWQSAGLLKPSFVRPKIAAIEPQLIVHNVGQLVTEDLDEVDRKLRHAMGLLASSLPDIAHEIDFLREAPEVVQTVAEKSVAAVAKFAETGDTQVNLESINKLLQTRNRPS